ncbi:RNA polymerase sigma-70 factor, ECF subfamily [Cytobacillus horneckiae]|uniref:RNA polymerase sigma factor SigY n=1 Tax=Cytobacillus horneckiae TaxID=549687 RepID=UPI00156237D2|nr:RNA polymerase sigma factor SigY [Cytobacillus horneckiae]MBN6887681.1 RNA polymerase sigma factor SigY [Cytobacillus horneckiae]NRG45852.1 RNA polymerase sigma factor SigY [Bacillus sp. CRN 9]
MNEAKIIKKAKKGDHLAFASLFQQHYPILYKYLLKVTMNPDLSEELAQETMAKAIEKLPLFKGKSKFSTWLISIATNKYIDYHRKEKREKDWISDEEAYRKLKWRMESYNEDWNDALTELGKLSEGVRIPIILKHYYGYSYDEIGEMMNISAGTVKSRVHNGLTAVREGLNILEKR